MFKSSVSDQFVPSYCSTTFVTFVGSPGPYPPIPKPAVCVPQAQAEALAVFAAFPAVQDDQSYSALEVPEVG